MIREIPPSCLTSIGPELQTERASEILAQRRRMTQWRLLVKFWDTGLKARSQNLQRVRKELAH